MTAWAVLAPPLWGPVGARGLRRETGHRKKFLLVIIMYNDAVFDMKINV